LEERYASNVEVIGSSPIGGTMKYPEAGDKLWMVHDGYPLLIKVTVLGTDSFGYFIVDEPTGNSVESDALFDTVEAAADRMMTHVNDAKELWLDEFDDEELVLEEEMSLEQYRNTQKDWVAMLQTEIGRDPGGYGGVLHTLYPDKTREDWVTLRQVRELRGMPLSDFEELYR
jgi:hypothetical protein